MEELKPQVLRPSWIFANPGGTSTSGSKNSQICRAPRYPPVQPDWGWGAQGSTNPSDPIPWAWKAGLSPREGITHPAFPAGSQGSSLVLQREEQQTHRTAEGVYFWLPIQARIFKYPNSPQRISSLRLVPDLLMKILKKQEKNPPPPSPNTTPGSPRTAGLLQHSTTGSPELGKSMNSMEIP